MDFCKKVLNTEKNMPDKKISIICLKPYHKNQFIDFMQKWNNKSLLFDISVLDAYLDPNSKFPVLFGAFKKQILLFTIGLWKWETLPYATITFLSSRIGCIFFNPLSNGYNLCFDEILKYGHKNGILAYYLFRKKRNNNKIYSRHGYVNNEAKKYFSYTEAIIPRNTQPKEYSYWELMDKKTKPFCGEIRRIMLKPEFLDSLLWR